MKTWNHLLKDTTSVKNKNYHSERTLELQYCSISSFFFTCSTKKLKAIIIVLFMNLNANLNSILPKQWKRNEDEWEKSLIRSIIRKLLYNVTEQSIKRSKTRILWEWRDNIQHTHYIYCVHLNYTHNQLTSKLHSRITIYLFFIELLRSQLEIVCSVALKLKFFSFFHFYFEQIYVYELYARQQMCLTLTVNQFRIEMNQFEWCVCQFIAYKIMRCNRIYVYVAYLQYLCFSCAS